ncbi:hypothetical protein PIB30_058261 [Stylosanthes scabra]|uniref:Uncharacterized protein n=1 Tax=Stylosanthes scabra TaxID=79078 RepID=A0ABU6QKJ2_9FABA|nr:hypothetical protein [Stylosanthes scabra]
MDKGNISWSNNIVTEEKRVIAEFSECTQKEKGDCLPPGVEITLPPVGKCEFESNDLTTLKEIWFQYIQSHIDDDKGLTMYALAMYGLVLFPRVRGQIDGQVIKLSEQPWVPLTGPWDATSYAPALVRRQMGSLQFIPMTHGLSDIKFTYECPNTVCKVKEIITDWKDVRCVESGVPISDTTPGYPLWQANRGKGFKAPMITGPELPVHMFDDPIDYKVEMEYRYENAFRRLEEKEIILI